MAQLRDTCMELPEAGVKTKGSEAALMEIARAAAGLVPITAEGAVRSHRFVFTSPDGRPMDTIRASNCRGTCPRRRRRRICTASRLTARSCHHVDRQL